MLKICRLRKCGYSVRVKMIRCRKAVVDPRKSDEVSKGTHKKEQVSNLKREREGERVAG